MKNSARVDAVVRKLDGRELKFARYYDQDGVLTGFMLYEADANKKVFDAAYTKKVDYTVDDVQKLALLAIVHNQQDVEKTKVNLVEGKMDGRELKFVQSHNVDDNGMNVIEYMLVYSGGLPTDKHLLNLYSLDEVENLALSAIRHGLKK